MRDDELVSIKEFSMWLKNRNIHPQDEVRYCYLQDRNMFGGEQTKCSHCKERLKTVDHLATQCDRILCYDYTRRHNEVVRCIHSGLCTKYGVKAHPRMRSHSVQEIVANENVDTRVRTAIKVDAK
ncbi:hypothetical protein PAEPH01_1130 [Pancytospora epiphaga]|nr:hypothetical protein PAEPH01_1130 [Pancytospora epiphaga]